jgi:hypothetical protein
VGKDSAPPVILPRLAIVHSGGPACHALELRLVRRACAEPFLLAAPRTLAVPEVERGRVPADPRLLCRRVSPR